MGVMFTPSALISIASELMENGNITDFVRKNQDYNRVDLVSEVEVRLFWCVDYSGSSLVQ